MNQSHQTSARWSAVYRIAADPRLIIQYLSRLQYFGFMKQLNAHVMQIQPNEVNREEVQKQQKKLDEVMLQHWGVEP
jgi:hypothetical protein